MTIKYPYRDELGYRWIDPSTFVSKEMGNCFYCNYPTNQVDINYEAYYCGQHDEEIARELGELEYTTAKFEMDT